MATALLSNEDPRPPAKFSELLTQFERDELRSIEEAALTMDRPAAAAHLEYLFRLAQLRAAVVERPSPANQVATYYAGTLFLKECFFFLTPGKPESAHYVSGIRDRNIFTLDRMVTFKYAKQSVTGIEGDPADTARALTMIDDFGHKLHAWFHSHPDMGAESYIPSGTDMRHQARLEEGGYPAIGAVFSRDGYIKFFSHKRTFKVMVYGKGVEKVDDTLFRFEPGFVDDKGR